VALLMLTDQLRSGPTMDWISCVGVPSIEVPSLWAVAERFNAAEARISVSLISVSRLVLLRFNQARARALVRSP